ncbi:ergothioneine biosynthesis PLP-dependent enzyme EgtE [Nonomuraea sp. KC401]|uniref:ergothioneine biosynthesis PLP-dependent enzyme EgtE n=1 Tax=unclassified Nonomuraea TaxID=2593643 RepID=UPI0010FEC951|nr:ergothioneine biosynthesis PLP-dependent enzyme EgtE [Nonomuraea sp. KC401]NBE94440.1 ergothioneine biosynthesis PLP-dependent enzyme EgtE [Nonomuraea sp. K271]TLF72795.1 ergothioneine biosynthesis PLP-dependent enzyme EgtE [Nonomuraea sp. KC401]
MIGKAWRAARSVVPPGHLDAAGCNVPSDRVLDTVVERLRREREHGGYAAEPGLTDARSALAALLAPAGVSPGDVAFVESGTAAMAALLGGLRLPPGSRVGFARTEYGSTLMLLRRLAADRSWTLVELPVDAGSRLDLDGLASALAGGLDLVTLVHIASHRGVVQPAREAGALCRAAGVPLVLDACQSFGHTDVGGVGATAYVGTSRKWLAGPRGTGFLIVPGLTTGTAPGPPWGPPAGMDAAAPALGGHVWGTDDLPEPLPGAIRYESSEGAIASRAGLGAAVREYQELGPADLHEHGAELGRTARHLLHGAGGWHVAEPLDEPSAIVTLRPPPGDSVEAARARAAEAGLLVGAAPVARAPLDLREPVLRVSPAPGTEPETLHTLARILSTPHRRSRPTSEQ